MKQGVFTTHKLLLVVLSLALLSVGAATHSQPAYRANSFSLTFDNDVITSDDGGYTSGLSFSWARAPYSRFSSENLPHWIHALVKNLYINTLPNKTRAVSYTLVHAMQTPDDIETEALLPDQAPYVGFLGWRGSLHAFDDAVADRLAALLGVVGPITGAEHLQRAVHDLTNSSEPRGWNNQLENEPVFRIGAERIWQLHAVHFGGGTRFDVIGVAQGGVGNFRSDLGVGFSLRYGRSSANSFATANVFAGQEMGPLAAGQHGDWSIFFNVLGRYVVNDISIDGNTFEDSHSVDLKHAQALATLGVAVDFRNWTFSLSGTIGSDRYRTQPANTHYGTLSVILRH